MKNYFTIRRIIDFTTTIYICFLIYFPRSTLQMGPRMIKLLLKVSEITRFPHHISQQCNYQEVIMLTLKSHLPLILWLWMKTTFYQMIKNWTNTDREEDHIVDSFVGWKIKALCENGWLVKSIITTSYMKNTMSYMRMTLKTASYLTILMVVRFS